jgi:hypothetical protein
MQVSVGSGLSPASPVPKRAHERRQVSGLVAQPFEELDDRGRPAEAKRHANRKSVQLCQRQQPV